MAEPNTLAAEIEAIGRELDALRARLMVLQTNLGTLIGGVENEAERLAWIRMRMKDAGQ